MKLSKKELFVVFVFASIAATAAHAGPPVTVVFKNDLDSDATYTITNHNEASTYANASPKPEQIIPPKQSDSYRVTSTINPDFNYADVRVLFRDKWH